MRGTHSSLHPALSSQTHSDMCSPSQAGTDSLTRSSSVAGATPSQALAVGDPEPHADENKQVDSQEETEVIITMVHDGEDAAWDSDVDSTGSTSSMPAYKRGNHDEISMQQIQEAIQQELKPKAETRGGHQHSMHILADSRMQNWPARDNRCKVDYHPGWSFQQWLSALCTETIRIDSNTSVVILYLEKSLMYEDAPPLKNGLQAICKVIGQHSKGIHIFVSNLLPKPSSSLLGKPRVESNFILLQAVRSVNRVLKKIHFLTVFEHSTSQKGRIIRPTHQYFPEDGQLTAMGCMVLRECFMREAGLKTYWF